MKGNTEGEMNRGSSKNHSNLNQDDQFKRSIESVYSGSDLKYFPKRYYLSIPYQKKTDTTFFPSVNESNKQDITSKYIIHHENWFRSIWDFFIFLGVLYCAIITPIYLSFLSGSSLLSSFEIVIEILFILDFILNCFTTYRDDDKNLIHVKKKIFVNYLLNWFFLDLLFIFPIEVMFYKRGFIKVIRIFKDLFKLEISILKWIKVFTLGKLFKKQTTGRFLKKLKLVKDPALNSLLKLLLFLFLLSHLFSCFFVYLGNKSVNGNRITCLNNRIILGRLRIFQGQRQIDTYFTYTVQLSIKNGIIPVCHGA